MNLPPHQRPNVIAPDASTKRVALGLVGGECAELTVHDTASPGTLYANAGFLSGYCMGMGILDLGFGGNAVSRDNTCVEPCYLQFV